MKASCAKWLVLAAAAVLIIPATAGANLLTNGNFEGAWTAVPDPIGGFVGAGWTPWTDPLPATQWSASGHPALWSMPGNSGQPDPNINNYQKIIGGNIRSSNFRGGFLQVVNTVPGQMYDLDLDAKTFRTNITNFNTTPLVQFGYDTTGQTTDPLAGSLVWTTLAEEDAWSHYSVRFAATGSQTSIWTRAQITDADSTVHADFDNISVTSAAGLTKINIIDGPTATIVSDSTYEIAWTTDVPSSSVVEYGLNAPNGDEGLAYAQTASSPGNTTQHVVILPALVGDSVYNYRVVSAAAGSKTAYSLNKTFRTPPPAAPFLTNGSFEIIEGAGPTRTAPPWRSFPVVGGGDGGDQSGYVGPYFPNRWFQGIRAHDGQFFGAAAASWDRKQGGFFQRVQAVPGMTYTARAFIATVANGGAPWDCQVWLGIDPKGGVDPGPAQDPNVPGPPPAPWITWSAGPTHGSNTTPPEWIETSVSAVAESNVITVFVRFQQKWPIFFNITAVDAVTLEGPPAEVVEVPTVGAARALPDGAYVEFTTDKIVTLVPMMESGYFYMQDSDGTSGIRVESSTSVMVGDKVGVKGILQTNPNGERVLRDTTVTPNGAGATLVRKLRNKDVGGGGYDGGTGLTNQGLLVKVNGQVTNFEISPLGEPIFYINDGSNIESEPGKIGIKVVNTMAFPFIGDYVEVTGVVVSEMQNGQKVRVLRGREDPSEVVTLAP